MGKVECLGWNTMLYLRSASSLAYSLNFSLPSHPSPRFLTFKQSVCFLGSCYAVALWSALTERTPFQRALTTPGDLYKIRKDHNKHLQKISIYRDRPGHTFYYVNCPSNHLTQASFSLTLHPPRSVSCPDRALSNRACMTRTFKRTVAAGGNFTSHSPHQTVRGRKEGQRKKEQGMDMMIVWSRNEKVKKKVWRKKEESGILSEEQINAIGGWMKRNKRRNKRRIEERKTSNIAYAKKNWELSIFNWFNFSQMTRISHI